MDFSILNNREWALTLWIGVAVVFFMFTKAFRQVLLDSAKILFSLSLGSVILAMLLYIIMVVALMYKAHFWNATMLKDTIMWTLTVGFVIFGNSISKAAKEDRYFKEIIIENFKIAVIIEFIVNFYVFSFWIELILVPVGALMGGMIAVASSKPEYKQVSTFLNSLLMIFGFVCITYAVYHIIAGFGEFATFENLEGFLLPILLTFSFLPFAYLLAAYSIYEVFFIRINQAYRHKPLMAKYTRWQVLKTGRLNLSKVRTLSKDLQIFMINSKSELREALSKIIN